MMRPADGRDAPADRPDAGELAEYAQELRADRAQRARRAAQDAATGRVRPVGYGTDPWHAGSAYRNA